MMTVIHMEIAGSHDASERLRDPLTYVMCHMSFVHLCCIQSFFLEPNDVADTCSLTYALP